MPVKKGVAEIPPSLAAEGALAVPGRPVEPPPEAPSDGGAYDLGKLNRHWYRRCLDALGRTLNSSGTSPSIEQLRELCDRLITSFLTAVTGQSPDSDRPQFPADRAYYIPFAGDRSGKFNFAKPYFQLLRAPHGYPPSAEQSLWSFLPWIKKASEETAGRSDLGIEIDQEKSLDGKQGTISFAELLKGNVAADSAQDNTGALRLRKSLLLRGENDALAKIEKFDLRDEIAAALVGIFDVYKAFPGNAAVELLLLNHYQILRWLWQLSLKGAGTVGAPRDDVDDELFGVLLDAYFFGGDQRSRETPTEAIDMLRSWVKNQAETLSVDVVASKRNSPFREAVRKRMKTASAAETAKDELNELRPLLDTFRKFFLTPQVEGRLEGDLAASLPDDPRRAGTAKRSFVWVSADFQDLESSLPKHFSARSSKGRMSGEEAQQRLAAIGLPYQLFFQRLEAATLKESDYKDALDSYWRTRGDAARRELIFASFDGDTGLPALPPGEVLTLLDVSEERRRPQNIFLRVKICDSLNEPMIDGLFVFTTDHDEAVVRGKKSDERREDVEDLLAFGKVFFFIVRDHLHGLDRARESADIGRLNQHLYDRRLAALDRCMNLRLATSDFQTGGVSNDRNWGKFTYEILNNFAYSLVEKPEDVRNETFPYDRLLIIPLPDEIQRDTAGDRNRYELPFYLFQALYAECRGQKIHEGMYSLLKPFQSPVEDVDEESEDGHRFHARSFQEVSDGDGRRQRLDEYLQKHYVGAHDPSGSEAEDARRAPDEPASYVVKTASQNGPSDLGRDWANWACAAFWSETKQDLDLWLEFLCDLTDSYRQLLLTDADAADAQDRMWFLCRYGLLRAAMQHIIEQANDDEQFKILRDEYKHELSLRFGDNADLDLLRLLLDGKGGEPIAVLEKRRMIANGPAQLGFVDYLLKKEDRWARRFLKILTELVLNEKSGGYETFYQDLLTRPVEGRRSTGTSKHKVAAGQIGKRIPQYDNIEQGDDAIATFLGVLNLIVGTTDLDRRRLRCVIVMIRDYDDTKTGRVQSESEARKRLEVDRGDLTLYTRTFFQNVHRFLTTARERQQVRVLSTDITQIARSWYSNGIDSFVASLQERIQNLVEGPEMQKLGRLRPEIVDCAFVNLLNVLIRKEKQRDRNRDIELESFPFDRLLHVPLLLGPTDAARWCYARATYDDPKTKDSEALYEQIRKRGRHALLKGGEKIVAASTPVFLGPGDFFAKADAAHDDVQTIISRLAGQPALLDRFVRRLNEAHALQTLTVAGTLYHLLKRRQSADGVPAWMPGAERLVRELRGVLQRSVRSLERERDRDSITVLTEAHVERPIKLVRTSADPERLYDILRDTERIPLLHELFAAIEGPQYRYGLTGEGSKVFHVYYSIPGPDGFIERDELDSCYRGLFCLIVDDAKTDDKSQSELETLSDAEAADLDDIRTFAHNAMCSLGQVLWQQALQHRLLRPGVAQDIMGMMHRLKNELNSPVSALSSVGRALDAPATIPDRTHDLKQKIADANQTIEDIQELFKQMKRLSEYQHGDIPLQTFSSDWLAWTFLEKLARICLNAIRVQRGGGDNANMREISKLCSEAAARTGTSANAADGANGAADAVDSVERVQKALFDLAKLFGAEYAPASGTTVEFIFGFEAFTVDRPLEFRGSYLLDEALNTLIENAFQALLSYLETKMQEQQPNVVGRLRFVCRPNEEREDEILLELRNSSNALPPKLLDELNADPPRTVSAQIHAEVSGKKGGSGFGHYFARRIVSEYCGGRQARRQLDIHIEYSRGTARSQIRLLRPEIRGFNTVEMPELLRAVASELNDARVLRQEIAGDGVRFGIPGEIHLRVLLRALRQLLADKAAMVFDDLHSLFKLNVCGELLAQVDKFRELLSSVLEDATPARPELQLAAAELRECRGGSLHDLNDVFEQWRQKTPGTLATIIEALRGGNHETMAVQIERVRDGQGFSPVKLLPDFRRSFFAKKFRAFAPYLRPSALNGGFEPFIDSVEKLDVDRNGLPAPKQRPLAEAFRESRFAYDLHGSGAGAALHVWAYVSPDGEGSAPDFDGLGMRELNTVDLYNQYKRRMLGRTIAQHQDAFRSNGKPAGSLRIFSATDPAVPAWKAEIALAALPENESMEVHP